MTPLGEALHGYDPEKRARALAELADALAAAGGRLVAAARALGVPPRTAQRWLRDDHDVAALVAAARRPICASCGGELWDMPATTAPTARQGTNDAR